MKLNYARLQYLKNNTHLRTGKALFPPNIGVSPTQFVSAIENLRFIPDEKDEDLKNKAIMIRCGKDIHCISISAKGQLTFLNHPRIKDEATMWTIAHPNLGKIDEKRLKNCLLLYRLVKNPNDFLRYFSAGTPLIPRGNDFSYDSYNGVDPNVREFLTNRVQLIEMKKRLFCSEVKYNALEKIIIKQINNLFLIKTNYSSEDKKIIKARTANSWPKAIDENCFVQYQQGQPDSYHIRYEHGILKRRKRYSYHPPKPDKEFIASIYVTFNAKNWYQLYKKNLNHFNGYLVVEYIREARPGYHMVRVVTPAKNRTLHVKTALINPGLCTMSWVTNEEAPRIRTA